MLLIFSGLGWWITGGFDISLPDMPNVKEWFASDKESNNKKTTTKRSSSANSSKTGQVIDSYKGVKVYYNGNVGNVSGRNTTKDGYNLGLKYQCVEFGKRFFYEAYGHKMPDSYGHAKDFYNPSLPSGSYNKTRGMYQYSNGGRDRPKANDMVIIGGSGTNQFGHLFIITKVTTDGVEFIQQNPGARNPSRGTYPLIQSNGSYKIDGKNIMGWLRMA